MPREIPLWVARSVVVHLDIRAMSLPRPDKIRILRSRLYRKAKAEPVPWTGSRSRSPAAAAAPELKAEGDLEAWAAANPPKPGWARKRRWGSPKLWRPASHGTETAGFV